MIMRKNNDDIEEEEKNDDTEEKEKNYDTGAGLNIEDSCRATIEAASRRLKA